MPYWSSRYSQPIQSYSVLLRLLITQYLVSGPLSLLTAIVEQSLTVSGLPVNIHKRSAVIRYTGTGVDTLEVTLAGINRADYLTIQRYDADDIHGIHHSIPDGDTGFIFQRSSSGGSSGLNWILDAPAASTSQKLTLSGTGTGYNESGVPYRIWAEGTRSLG